MTQATDLERAMRDLINEERQANGLEPLELELQLNSAAEDHSDWMLDTDRFSHTGVGGSSAGDRIVAAGFDLEGSWAWGENIAYSSTGGDPGLMDEVERLHEALMDSPGHRANILSDDFDYLGIGIEVGEFDGFEAVMITQNFASTDAQVNLDPDTPDDTGGSGDNAAPVLTAGDVTLSRERGERYADVVELITVSDPDGDAIAYYELRDTEGRDNYLLDDGTRIDASQPYRLPADALDDLLVRFNAAGTVTGVEIRAFDGTDFSAWDTITITTTDGTGGTAGGGTGGGGTGGSTAPVLTAQDVTLSKARGERYADVADLIDAGTDVIEFYELRDTEGRDNFLLRDGTKLDASEPLQLDADDLDQLMVRFNAEGSVTTVDIRAFDGSNYSDWAEIAITTLAADDQVA